MIDLDPEGRDKGGEITASGSPEVVVREKRSYTGRYPALLLEAGCKGIVAAELRA